MHIPLVVVRPIASDIPRTGEPLTFGVPVPRGALFPTQQLEVVSSHSRTISADVRVLDRWPDGSVRWALVDTTMDDAFFASPPELQVTERSAGQAALSYQEESDGVVVDTGAAHVHIRVGGAFPFAQVQVKRARVLSTADPYGLVGTDASGRSAQAVVERVHIEHRGVLRASVAAYGSLRIGTRRLALEARVDLYAGQAAARVRCTVRNPDRAKHPGNYWDLGDPGSVLIKDLSLVLPLAENGSPAETSTSYSTEIDAPWETTEGPLEIYQDSSGGENWKSPNHVNRERRVPVSFRGYRLRAGGQERSGLRATPAVYVDAGSVGIGAAARHFWQNFPMAIETAERRLTVRLFPGQFADLHELQGGEQKTHDIMVAFDRASRLLLDWARSPSRLAATPDWTIDSGAVDFLGPLEPGHRALANQAIEGGDTFERKREVVDQYGWRHFGEIYGDHEAIGHAGPAPLVSHYNNQYDPVLGFALQYLRTADARWDAAMHELASHVVDIDIYHTRKDKSAYNGGLFWHTYHYGDADTATHRTYPRRNTGTVFGGGPSADHNYPSGLVLHYFLTGDEASRRAAIGLAQYVIDLDDGRLSPFRFLSHADTGLAIITRPDYFGPSRASGNSLNALVDGHRVSGDPKFLAKADQLVLRVIHPDDDQKRYRLDEPEYRWFYAMFLQALGKYLHHKASIGQLDRAYAHGRESLLAYARWMADHEYPYLTKPEKLEYPTETWAAQDIRKTDIFCFAAMHTTGTERERFVERARFFHRTSIETLSASATRALARPVVVLLTSGSLLAWLDANPTFSEPEPEYRGEIASPVPFVPQRKIAERRAMLIGAAGAVVTAVGAVIAGLVWWLG